jgi:hypothetical protein
VATCIQAQQFPPVLHRVEEPVPFVSHSPGHGVLLGANMLLSGATAGVLRWFRGGSFVDGFSKGAAGGAAIYAGKVLAVQRGTALPLLGREAAAVGASAVRNAGAGVGLLEHITLPVGPVRVHLARGEAPRTWVSVDMLAVGGLAAALLSYDCRIDWSASLAAAAPVFIVSDPDHELPWNGRQLGSLVLLRNGRWTEQPLTDGRTFAHERVHLLQYDQMALLWADPLESALLAQWRWTRAIRPYVDLGLNGAVNAAARSMPRDLNPLEIEATYLAGHR